MREFENCAKNKDVSKVCVHDVEGIGITRFETLFAVILAIITLHPCQFIQFTSCRFYLRCSDNTSFLTIYWTLLSILRESGFFPTLHAAPWCVSSSSNLDTVLATFRQDESINNSFGSAHCQLWILYLEHIELYCPSLTEVSPSCSHLPTLKMVPVTPECCAYVVVE